MECQDLPRIEALEKYLAGKLDSELADELEVHLFDCTKCSDALATFLTARGDLAERAYEIRSDRRISSSRFRWVLAFGCGFAVCMVSFFIAWIPLSIRSASPPVTGISEPKVDGSRQQEALVFDEPIGFLGSMAASPDGKSVAMAQGPHIRVWDLASGMPLLDLRGQTNYVTSIAFSPDARTLASGGGDRIVLLWDLATGKQKNVLVAIDAVVGVAFTPDGHLLTRSFDGTLSFWDVNSAMLIRRLQLKK